MLRTHIRISLHTVQRSIEPANPIHVLPVLALLRFANPVILVIARDFSLFRTAKALKSHDPLHLFFTVEIF